jgi:hypothetical protein
VLWCEGGERKEKSGKNTCESERLGGHWGILKKKKAKEAPVQA